MRLKRFLALLLCLVPLLSLSGCKARDYSAALALLEIRELPSARRLFVELGDYRHAAAKVKECDYVQAGQYLSNGEYDEAEALFASLGDFLDAQNMALESRYQKAQDLLTREQYDDARETFLSLAGFRDSAEQADNAYYKAGLAFYYAGDYSSALPYFTDLSGFESADRFAAICRLRLDSDAFIDAFAQSVGDALSVPTVFSPHSTADRTIQRLFRSETPSGGKLSLFFSHADGSGILSSTGLVNSISLRSDGSEPGEFFVYASAVMCCLDSSADPDAVTELLNDRLQTIDGEGTAQFVCCNYPCSLTLTSGDNGRHCEFGVTIPELVY